MPSPHILFVSANAGGGGSEELWVQTAARLKSAGSHVMAATTWSPRAESRLRQLQAADVPHVHLADTLADKVRHRLRLGACGGALPLRRLLRSWKPSLILFNSGTCLDGLPLLKAVSDSGVPFVVVTHLVSTDNWPDDKTAAQLRTLFGKALHACFVSQHNLSLFETQTGGRLGNCRLVRNPYLVGHAQALPWPSADKGADPVKLAFPARIHPRTKGHDMLVEVLSSERWRPRPLEVSFFGKGPWQGTLESLIASRGLSNVAFRGHVSDVEGIWRSHHALILPSRHEGLPICVVESMMAGRPCIVNPAGGSAEFLEDGVTGFIASSCTASALDEAMERAWQARHQWPQMGQAAAAAIRSKVPADPAGEFAAQVLSWASA